VLSSRLIAAAVGLATMVSSAIAQERNVVGEWSSLRSLEIVPSATALLPNGRVLLWSANGATAFNGNSPRVHTIVYNPETNTHQHIVDSIPHNMFCTGTTQLADGRLLTNGGNQSFRTSIYNASAQRFEAQDEMEIGRGYNANTILQDGRVMTIGGSWSAPTLGGKNAEILTVGGTWRVMSGIPTTTMEKPDATKDWAFDSHFWLQPAGNGRVFQPGPSVAMHWIDTRGNGQVIPAGNRGDDSYSVTAASVMFDKGKILIAGGAANYTLSSGLPATKTSAYIVDINGDVKVSKISPMVYPRGYANGVVLPDGKVMMVGGMTQMLEFSNAYAVLPTEVFDPRTNSFSLLAPIQVPRNYHSVALLLPDARVLSAGGGLCGGCTANQPNMQVFSPPYLFDSSGNPAVRPVITDAPTAVNYGSTVTVTTDSDVTAFSMVRFGATTHTVNNDQRRLSLTFRKTGTNTYSIDIPSNPGWLLPGNWMLFAMNADGVPSVARTVRVNLNDAVEIVSPIEISGRATVAMSVPVTWTSLGPSITFSGSGLPAGLSVNPTTGRIEGTPTVAGRFVASITGAGGGQRISTEFFVDIDGAPSQPNRPPVISAPGTVNLVQGGAVTVDVSASDPDGDTLTFSATGLPGGVTINSGTGAIRGNANTAGVFNATVRATDPDGANASASITFNVQVPSQPNRPPVVSAPGTVNLMQGGAVTVNVTASDPDGDTLTFSASGLPGGVTINSGTGAIRGNANTAGVFNATVRATDPDGANDTAQITFDVEALPPPNGAPQISAPANVSAIVGRPVSVPVSATDPDGDTLTFTATDLPAGLTIDPVGGAISGKILVMGEYTATVGVSDPDGATDSATIRFVAEFGSLPGVASLPVKLAAVGQKVTYTPTLVNAEDVTFLWSFGDGTTESSFTASATRTHVFDEPGIYQLTIMMRAPDGRITTYSTQQVVHPPVRSGVASLSSPGAAVTGSGSGVRVWVTNRDNDSVSVIDVATRRVLREIPTGDSPEGVAVAPNGRVWVVNRGSATVSIIDPAAFRVVKTVKLPRGSAPQGIAFVRNGNALVTLEARRSVAVITPAGSVQKTRTTSSRLRHLAYDPLRDRVVASRFVSPPVPGESTAAPDVSKGGGVVQLLDAAGRRTRTVRLAYDFSPESEASAPGIPNYLGAAAIAPDGKTAWVPSKKDNIGKGMLRSGAGLDFQTSVRAILSRIDLATGKEIPGHRIDIDNTGIAKAIVFHPTGAFMFVALESSREISVVDPINRREMFRFNVGRAPSALAITPDGRTLLAYNFMDRSVSVVDLGPLLDTGQNAISIAATVKAVGKETLSSAVLLGKQHFYDAADPRLARDGYLSCAVCHDNGESDGRTWDFTGFGEGLRNTTTLVGKGGMKHGFLHWSANFDEVQDFEGQIRGFAGGAGLMSDADFNAGTRSQPLGTPKAGLSGDLDALAAYVSSLRATPPSPFRAASGKMTKKQIAGRKIFREEGCASCHAGPRFTISGGADRLKNIGTIDKAAGKRLAGPLKGIDVPTLKGIHATAPYLHDGSAATIGDAIRKHKGVKLSNRELRMLSEYLMGL
jgi:YVTN family beta-propeller protein